MSPPAYGHQDRQAAGGAGRARCLAVKVERPQVRGELRAEDERP
jgi:hypothetical protein